MRNRAVAFALTFVAFCPSLQAQEADTANATEERAPLIRVSGPFSETWILPTADFTRFGETHAVVDTLGFLATDVRQDPPPGAPYDAKGYALSPREQGEFREVVATALAEELSQNRRARRTTKEGQDTLSVRASILDIAIFVPPMPPNQVDVYPSEIGVATVRFELIDPEDGSMLATLEERRTIRPRGQTMGEVSIVPVNRRTMWIDVGRWSRHAASDLLKFIENRQAEENSPDEQ